MWALPFIIALATYGIALSALDPVATGDEPSYYLIATSLVFDGDVDLANQYASVTATRQACPTCPPGSLSAAIDYRGDGTLRPYHYIGLPLLIAPSVAITKSQTGPRLTVLLLSALAAFLLFRLLGRVMPRQPWLRWVVWIGVAFCMPVTVYATQVYPEMVAALAVIVVLSVLAQKPVRRRSLVGACCVTAFMPWLHVRLTILAVALTAVLCVRGLRAASLAGMSRRRSAAGASSIAIPLILSMGLMMFMFNRWYGSPRLGAAYDIPRFEYLTDFEPSFAYRNFFGSLLNPSYGLLPWAPILLVGILGLGIAFRRARLTTIVGVTAGLIYLGVSNGLGVTHGTSPPARYEITLVLALGVPLGLVAAKSRFAAILATGLAALSLALTVQATRHYLDLYPAPGGGDAVTVPLARTLAAAWPRFWERPAIALPADQRPRNVGRVSTEAPLPAGSTSVAESVPADGGGLLADGFGSGLAPGGFRASVSLSRIGGSFGEVPGVLRVVGRSPRTTKPTELARLPLDRGLLPPDGEFHTVSLPFRTHGDELVDVRIVTAGRATLRAGTILITPDPPAATGGLARYPSLLAVSAWVVGLMVTLCVFALSGRRASYPTDRPSPDGTDQ